MGKRTPFDYLPFFVYGTLLPGQPNYPLWAAAIRSEQPATLPNGRLYDMAQLGLGHYPLLVEDMGNSRDDGRSAANQALTFPSPPARQGNTVVGVVVGVMVEIGSLHYQTVLRTLDRLEGYRPERAEESFYRRVPRLVRLASGGQEVAWVYLGRAANVAGLEAIEGGDWKAYCASKQAEVARWWAEGGRVSEYA
jgi:gamma-glutamylcyclotransferase (GGCT)/AIG2-like uncharacterized protein YtfP